MCGAEGGAGAAGRARTKGAGEQVGHPAFSGHPGPRPRLSRRPGTTSSPASSGVASGTAGPSHTDYHPPPLTRPPQVQPSASPPTLGKPTPIPGPHRGRPQRGCPLLAQAVAQVRADTPTPSWAVTPGLQRTCAPLGPHTLGAATGSHPDCRPHKWPSSRPEAASCPLPSVSGSQSRAPGTAGGDGLGAQDGAGVGPRGTGLSAAAEGRPGEREGGSAWRPCPGAPRPPHLTPLLASLGLQTIPWPQAHRCPLVPASGWPPRSRPVCPGRSPQAPATAVLRGPSLRRPLACPGCSLGPRGHRPPQGPRHCRTASRPPPQLQLAHLHDARLTPHPVVAPPNLEAVPASLLGDLCPPHPRLRPAKLTWSCS